MGSRCLDEIKSRDVSKMPLKVGAGQRPHAEYRAGLTPGKGEEGKGLGRNC